MTDTDDRYLKTGVFLAPFHPLHENPLLALERDMAPPLPNLVSVRYSGGGGVEVVDVATGDAEEVIDLAIHDLDITCTQSHRRICPGLDRHRRNTS